MNLKIIFCRLVGLFGIAGGIYIFFSDPETYNSASFLLKYTWPVMGVNLGAVIFFLPELTQKGWCVLDYYNANEHQKAKANLTIFGLGAPGLTMLLYSAFKEIQHNSILYVFVAVILYHIISSGYVLFIKKGT